jgi:AraC family transcriptional regulator of adaptative response / DNA-3-methyladenine glycosylase II
MAVRAVLGQQITVKAARWLAGRFAAAFGTRIETPFPSIPTVVPTPQPIAGSATASIAALGVARTRAFAIGQLARACAAGELALDAPTDVEQTLVRLRALPGIGEWTAQYIAMRTLAWPDAFPHTDYGLRKALAETRPSRVLARAEAWRPWRAYATLYLWETLKEPIA